MRIAVVTDAFPPKFGGMASHAYYISRYLSKKHHVKVIKAKKPVGDYSNEPFEAVNLLTLRFPTLDLFLLLRFLKKYQPDVLHICDASLCYIELTKRYPTITRVVGNDFLRPWCGFNLPLRFLLYRVPIRQFKIKLNAFETNLRKKISLRRLKKCHTIVANSEWTKEQLLYFNVSPEKIRVIAGGVDTALFYPNDNKSIMRKKLRLPLDRIILLTVAGLVEKKGIDVVLKALPRVIQKNGNIFYVIVGEGRQDSHLKQLASYLNLSDYVLFTGKKQHIELVKYYWASDMYVQASRNEKLETGFLDVETMGRTFCEAGACKLPVITTNSGGISSVVKHMENGILLENPLDAEVLSEKILLLADNEDIREKMGQKGFEMAKNHFSWEKVGDAFENIMIQINVRV